MHWITELLIWLSEDNCKHITNYDITGFNEEAEKIAKEAVKEGFLNAENYALGVQTPHIVFNYLDYLLWSDEQEKYKDFTFEFRNSVEHWYPQNPSEGTFEQWKAVDRFGNLCIIQSNVNSKFSNLSPEAKKSTFKNMISKGSIKLRMMSDLTEEGKTEEGKTIPANSYWQGTICEEHEKKMLNRLKEACGK